MKTGLKRSIAAQNHRLNPVFFIVYYTTHCYPFYYSCYLVSYEWSSYVAFL